MGGCLLGLGDGEQPRGVQDDDHGDQGEHTHHDEESADRCHSVGIRSLTELRHDYQQDNRRGDHAEALDRPESNMDGPVLGEVGRSVSEEPQAVEHEVGQEDDPQDPQRLSGEQEARHRRCDDIAGLC